MIKMICPNCGKVSVSVKVDVIYAGVQVVSPRYSHEQEKVGLTAGCPLELKQTDEVEGYACPSCGKVTKVDEWRYEVSCSCGNIILESGDEREAVAKIKGVWCLDVGNVRCPECWTREDKTYCTRCGRRGLCGAYATYGLEEENE